MSIEVNDAIRLIMFVALVFAVAGEVVLWILSLGNSTSPSLHRLRHFARDVNSKFCEGSTKDDNRYEESIEEKDNDNDSNSRSSSNDSSRRTNTNTKTQYHSENRNNFSEKDSYEREECSSEHREADDNVINNNSENTGGGGSNSRFDKSWSSAPTLSAAAAETKQLIKQKFSSGVTKAKLLVRPLLLRIESELDAESDTNSNDDVTESHYRNSNNNNNNSKSNRARSYNDTDEYYSHSDSLIHSPLIRNSSSKSYNSCEVNERNEEMAQSPVYAYDASEIRYRRTIVNTLIRNYLREQPLSEMQCSLTLQICTWNVDQTDPPLFTQYDAFYEWLLGASNAERVMSYRNGLVRVKMNINRNNNNNNNNNNNTIITKSLSPSTCKRENKNLENQEEETHQDDKQSTFTQLECLLEEIIANLPDVFVITLQEVDMGGVALVTESTRSSTSWTSAILNALHEASRHKVRYVKLKVVQLVGLVLMVIVKVEHAEYVSHVRLSLTRTGAMRVLGNKGSVAMRATIYGKRFLFIAAHFVAHKYNEQKRSYNYHAAINDIRFVMPYGTDDESEVLRTFINAQLLLLNSSSDNFKNSNSDNNNNSSTLIKGQSIWDRLLSLQSVLRRTSIERECKALDEHDYVIFLGDLNSRLHELESYEIHHRLRNGELDYLLCRDELRQGMVSGNVFDGFQEATIDFMPTYKYDKNSDLFDTSRKQRDPAWCDRILFRVLQVNDNNVSSLREQETTLSKYTGVTRNNNNYNNDDNSNNDNSNNNSKISSSKRKQNEIVLCTSQRLNEHTLHNVRYNDKGEGKHNSSEVIISPRHIHTVRPAVAFPHTAYMDLSHRKWVKLSEVHHVEGAHAVLSHSSEQNEKRVEDVHSSNWDNYDSADEDDSSSSNNNSNNKNIDNIALTTKSEIKTHTLRKRTHLSEKPLDSLSESSKRQSRNVQFNRHPKTELEVAHRSSTTPSSHFSKSIKNTNNNNNNNNKMEKRHTFVKRSASASSNKTVSHESPSSYSESLSSPLGHHLRSNTLREATFHAARRPCDVKVIEPRFPMISNMAEITEYYSVNKLKQSDHRPVAARLKVNVVKLSPELVQRIQEHLRHELKIESDGRLSWNRSKTQTSMKYDFTSPTRHIGATQTNVNADERIAGKHNITNENDHVIKSSSNKDTNKKVPISTQPQENVKRNCPKTKTGNDEEVLIEPINMSFTSITSIDT